MKKRSFIDDSAASVFRESEKNRRKSEGSQAFIGFTFRYSYYLQRVLLDVKRNVRNN